MNENLWGPSPRAAAALSGLLDPPGESLSAYGFPAELRAALAEHLNVASEEVLVTAGGDEAIAVLFRCFIDPGDAVLFPWPTFTTFHIEAGLSGAGVIRVTYGDDLALPRERYLEAVVQNEPRFAVLVNPNNPTGTTVDPDWILEVCRRAPKTLVIVDEAYVEYHGESVLSLSPRPHNLAVIRTFSKAYGLAAMRVGYVVADREVIESLDKIRLPFSISTPALLAASAALEDRDYLDQHVKALRREMESLAAELERKGFPSRTSRANFVLIQVGPRASEVAAALARRGILVSDRSHDPGLGGMLRAVVGRPEHNRQLVAALIEERSRLA